MTVSPRATQSGGAKSAKTLIADVTILTDHKCLETVRRTASTSGRRLQSLGRQPFSEVGGRLGLACAAQEPFAFKAGWHTLGLCAQTFCFFDRRMFKGNWLCETASLHDRCSIASWGGSATGVLITDDCLNTAR